MNARDVKRLLRIHDQELSTGGQRNLEFMIADSNMGRITMYIWESMLYDMQRCANTWFGGENLAGFPISLPPSPSLSPFPSGQVGAAAGLRAPVALASSASPQVRSSPRETPALPASPEGTNVGAGPTGVPIWDGGGLLAEPKSLQDARGGDPLQIMFQPVLNPQCTEVKDCSSPVLSANPEKGLKVKVSSVRYLKLLERNRTS
ncbi:uncharacterized protein LOC116523905 [Thamnophis elegans]|uniref:uncharacterized protein LOC116523905 n=1 Tax=Thamnophis elegans TaxID=35005 RepID=UPI00137771B4|nr:uncharacterized protein LOC116523905 [Thamnophis elegans]